jgi:hypothetical protein
MTSVFGSVVTPDQVSQAVENQFRTWSRSYFDHVGTARGFSRRLPSTARYRHTNDRPEKWPEDSLPCVVIFTADAPVADRSVESITLSFTTAVAVIDSAGGEDQQAATNKLVQARSFALALLLLEKPGLSVGHVEDLGDFVFGEMDREDGGRSMAAATFAFNVIVEDAFVIGPGPAVPTPDEDPPAPDQDLPTAETVEATVTKLD